MRFLHLGLVLSSVLTTKASDDPNHDNSVSENPTGQATVHGHPKVAAGFVRQKPIAEAPLMSSEADFEEHTMPPVMIEDHTLSREEGRALLKEEFGDDVILDFSDLAAKFSFHPTIKDKFICQCDPSTFSGRSQGDLSGILLPFFSGQGNCNLQTRDFNGREWCFLSRSPISDLALSSDCSDAKPSSELDGLFWSHAACDTRPKNSCTLCTMHPPNFFNPLVTSQSQFCRRVNGVVKCD